MSGWAPSPKPLWQELLGSTVIATVITVSFGTLAAQYLVAQYQAELKKYEIQVADYRRFLDTQDDAIKRTYELVGARLMDGDSLIALASGRFDDEMISKADQPAVREQRQQLRKRHGDVADQWSRGKEPLSLLISYSGDDVTAAWRKAVESTEAFGVCAEGAYVAFVGNSQKRTDSTTCSAERTAISNATLTLGQAVVRAREAHRPPTD